MCKKMGYFTVDGRARTDNGQGTRCHVSGGLVEGMLSPC